MVWLTREGQLARISFSYPFPYLERKNNSTPTTSFYFYVFYIFFTSLPKFQLLHLLKWSLKLFTLIIYIILILQNLWSFLRLLTVWHHLKFWVYMCLQGGIVYSNQVVMLSSMNSKGRIISSFSHELKPTLSIHQ